MADIFYKIASGINKGVATLGTGSKGVLEKARIKTVIANLETERKELAELLGMKIYEKCAKYVNQLEDRAIAGFVTEIDKRLSGIAEQEAEIRRIDAEFSQVTGQNVIGEGKNCACGNVNIDIAKFCARCGNAL